MKTAIITIGDEILIGQIVDTNSAWMAHTLTEAGFEITETHSIGDNALQIKNTLDEVFPHVDIILLTGGIGPTKDDITKKTLCEYFGTSLIFDHSVLENIKGIINWTNLNELTRNQAYVPKDCTVIQNRVGTAPITWFDYKGKVLVSMPGVPYEMKFVMENEIIPRLKQKYMTESYLSRTFVVGGYTESNLATFLTDFENNLPQGFGLAYLPSPAIMKLRLFVRGEQNKTQLEKQVETLRTLLQNAILAEEDISIEEILGERLLLKGLTLATAESCTGGNIAHRVTTISGASRYFKGSVVSYTNEVKKNVLGVSEQSLSKHTAVSEPVVIEMAKGVQRLMQTDCAIAVSGIAGPEGGTDENPVGTVWICTLNGEKCIARKYLTGSYRESNIMRATTIAIRQLLEMI